LVRAAALLGERLKVIGLDARRAASGHLPRLITELAAATDDDDLDRRVCEAACDLAGMNSALLCRAKSSCEATTAPHPANAVVFRNFRRDIPF
jgi:hypothetical protein